MTKHNSRTNKKKGATGARGHSKAKTVAIAVALGGLSAFGLWQCFESDVESPMEPFEDPRARDAIDVGAGALPDPTLVNEEALLEAENAEPKKEQDAPAAEGERLGSDISITEAGSALLAPDEALLEDEFPLHAVAYHFHTQIKEGPRADSRVVGYARRGATFRVGKRVSTKGCARGWHQVVGGGYICDGDGVNVAAKPVSFAPAPPMARLDDPLPYSYKYAKADGTPEYWRLPTPEETTETREVFDRIARSTADTAEGEAHDEAALAKVLARASLLDAEEVFADAGAPPPSRAEPDRASTTTSKTAREDAGTDDPFALPPYVHQRMAKGYYVSTDDVVAHEGAFFQRTVRGRFVPSEGLYPAKPSKLEGALVTDDDPLPMVFVVGGGVKLLERRKADGPLVSGAEAERYARFPLLGEETRQGKRYLRIGENLFVPARVAAVARETKPPEGLEEGERWIHVDLAQQTLVAYEGTTPVFATVVATGRKDFDTPTGEFRIYGKHVTITMDDPDGGDEAYSIEDVPWTQYFDEGYALHAAFWHDRFGRVRSHGCVNLSPADARRLFFWTGPHIPSGLHGAIATRDNPGTRVIITD